MTDNIDPKLKIDMYFSGVSVVSPELGKQLLAALDAVVAAAEQRGWEQARKKCRDCVVPGGNPEVAIERIDALVYKPEAGPR